jgi:malonate transporter
VSIALLLFPDFSLIALGALLYRFGDFSESFWGGVEKLVYFVLFSSLLFLSTATTRFDSGGTWWFIATGCIVTLSGVGLSFAIKPFFAGHSSLFASGAQTAFRFNSYIALAIAGRLAGNDGIALMALLLGTNVPISNAAAVWALARHGRVGLIGAMLRNPLILATVGGLIFNALGLHLPEFLSLTLARLGNASIALGLIAVGAGLRLTATAAPRALLASWVFIKLMVLPALALGLALYLHLTTLQREIVVMFGALPSASSAYILATRMGGIGSLVAFLISVSTVISVFTLPLWLVLVH